MSINFRVASIDGFGDRDDIALARDKAQGQATENYYAQLNQPIPDAPFAEAGLGTKISQIVKDLVARGGGRALYYNHQIEWDMDLSDAREDASLDAIIPEGWDSPVTSLEQIDVSGHAPGMDEYEIEVHLYEQ